MALLAHYRLGEGPRPSVLLHGFLGSGRNLRTLATTWLAADPSRTFLVADLTGHGTSPPLPPGADLTRLAADVLETARTAGLTGPLSLTGHSLGGRVALAALRLEPASVLDVTLLDISPGPVDSRRSATRRVAEALVRAPPRADDRAQLRAFLLGEGLSSPVVEWLLMNLEREPGGGVRWRLDREALLQLHQRVNAEDLWDVVEGPRRAPLRVIRGGASPYVAEEDVQRLLAAGVPVHTLPGAGHEVHVEALEPLVAALTST